MSVSLQQQQSVPQSPDEDCGHLHYPHPENGILIPLAVQSLQPTAEVPENGPWINLGRPTSRIPWLQASWYWILSPILVEGSDDRRLSPGSASLVFLRLIFVAPLTSFVVPSWTDGLPALIPWSQTQQTPLPLESSKYELFYDRLPAPLSHVSSVEAQPSAATGFTSNIQLGGQELSAESLGPPIIRQDATVPTRTEPGLLSLRPRFLCFLTDSGGKTAYRTISVSDYVREHGDQTDTEFIFVSYTRMQFRVATDEEIDTYDYPDEASREANRKLAKQDRETLARWGVDAALAAGKPAFWLDFECVRDGDGVARSSSKSEDVYRICDIVRAAHSMIIAIGPSTDDKVKHLLKGEEDEPSEIYDTEHSSQWLRQWGSRLWTLPELLLCPNEYRIKLYVFGESKKPKELAKRNFAERAWEDATSVKELVNHYEGSAILTPLQLIDIALECFARRNTAQFSAGDVAYAIMGLFPDSQRPQVNQNDSGFRAFARLALAIDDGNILARMLCVAPLRSSSQWSETTDYWGSRLRDFRPSCHVVDVTGSDALVIQDVLATPITWDKIDRSTHLKYGGMTFQILLTLAFNICWIFLPFYLWIGDIFPYDKNSLIVFSIIIYITVGLVIFFSCLLPFSFFFSEMPYDATKEKARFIGIQGAADRATVEKYIWGFDHGRLKQLVADDERDDILGQLRREQTGQMFTIVDTVSLTMTAMRCTAPPVALLVVGDVGGTDRALLCSFNCKTGSYHREKVLRIDMSISSRMHRTRSMHLCLTPLNPSATQGPPPGSEEHVRDHEFDSDTIATIPETPRFTFKSWGLYFRFVLIMVTATRMFTVDPTSLRTSSYIAYSSGILLAQLLAFVSFRNGVLIRVTAPALYCSEILYYLQKFDKYHRHHSMRLISQTLRGVAIGLLIPSLVFYFWAWFSRRQLTWIILAWAVLSCEIFRAVSLLASLYGNIYFKLLDFSISGMILALATFSSSYLKLPQDVSWLELPERLAVVSRAAISMHKSRERPKWLETQGSPWIFLVLYSGLIVLTGFISGTMSLNAPPHPLYHISELIPAASVIVVRGVAHSISRSSLPGFTYLTMFFCSFAGVFSRIRLHLLILPLIWTTLLDDVDTLAQAVGLLCLSILAWGIGGLISVSLISLDKITTRGLPLLAAIQTCLVVLAGLMAFAKKRRAASVHRTTVIQSQYHDSDEQLA